MRNLAVIFSFMLLVVACKQVQQIPVQTKIEVKERIVPVPVPADSSWFFAFLKCDSLNNVIISSYSESKSNTINQSIKITDNKLIGKFISKPNAVSVKVRDSIVIKEVPVQVPGETKIVFEMHWYQMLFMWIGIIVVLIILIYVLWKLIRK